MGEIPAILQDTEAKNRVMMYHLLANSHLNDGRHPDVALFTLIQCNNLDITDAA
jgi:hypothetical protein